MLFLYIFILKDTTDVSFLTFVNCQLPPVTLFPRNNGDNETWLCYWFSQTKSTLENTEGAIKNGQSRETGNIGYEVTQNKNITQYVLDTTIRKQTQIM